MRIGVFGGTFDPPHIGHIKTAESFYDELSLDLMYIIPASDPPHKSSDGYDDPIVRYSMCRHAFFPTDRQYVLSDIELARSGKSFTVDTLTELAARHPESELFLFVGGDMFFAFERWKDFEKIFGLCTVCCCPRTKDQREELSRLQSAYLEKYGAKTQILSCLPTEISSTDVRDAIGRRDDEICKNYLTANLYEYIIKRDLFGKNEGAALSERITDKALLPELEKECLWISDRRRTHIFAVRDQALEMAKLFLPHFGYGEEYLTDIAAAALLHDSTKEYPKHEQKKVYSEFSREKYYSEKVLHAYTAAYLARTEHLVNDRVFSSVYYHTTGKAQMNIFEAVIYLADFIEPTRSEESCLALRDYYYEQINEATNEDELSASLDRVLYRSFDITMKYLTSIGAPIHPDLYVACAYYKKRALL